TTDRQSRAAPARPWSSVAKKRRRGGSCRLGGKKTEDHRRIALRLEADALGGAATGHDLEREYLFEGEFRVCRQAELFEGQHHIAFMGCVRIEIDGDNDNIGAAGNLRITKDVGVFAVDKAQVEKFLHCRIIPSKLVENPDVLLDMARAIPVPHLVFVFFGVA